jgi:hypothetical protein
MDLSFFKSMEEEVDAIYLSWNELSKIYHLDSLRRLRETGEVNKDEVVRVMLSDIRNSLKEYFLIGHLGTWQE